MILKGQQTRHNSDSTEAKGGQPADNRPGAAKASGQTKMPPRRTWLWFVAILPADHHIPKSSTSAPSVIAGRKSARSPKTMVSTPLNSSATSFLLEVDHKYYLLMVPTLAFLFLPFTSNSSKSSVGRAVSRSCAPHAGLLCNFLQLSSAT
jgi:hypothetical protein